MYCVKGNRESSHSEEGIAMRNIPKLALIVPCYNEEAVLRETASRLTTTLKDLKQLNIISMSSRILFVDDGSHDSTWQIIESISKREEHVYGIKLSRNCGHQNALLAGMQHMLEKCDCLISIDADLQQDEKQIVEFVRKYMNGAEVVLGVRNDRKTDSFFKKITALSFYRFMKAMGVTIVKNHADYRLLSNRANRALAEFKEVNLFLRGLVPLLGFPTDYVFFDVSDRFAGSSKYTVSKMLLFAIDGITSFSIKPLRFISLIGFVVFLVSMIMGLYVLFIAIFTNRAIPGWASTVLPIYFLGGVQLFSMGVLGEYIGKIYGETKRRPRYIIQTQVDSKNVD